MFHSGCTGANEILKNALNNNDVAVGDVVAIEVLSGGDIGLYFQ